MFCVSIFIVSVTSSAQWEAIPDYPGPATDASFSFTIDGTAYLGGGLEFCPEITLHKKE